MLVIRVGHQPNAVHEPLACANRLLLLFRGLFGRGCRSGRFSGSSGVATATATAGLATAAFATAVAATTTVMMTAPAIAGALATTAGLGFAASRSGFFALLLFTTTTRLLFAARRLFAAAATAVATETTAATIAAVASPATVAAAEASTVASTAAVTKSIGLRFHGDDHRGDGHEAERETNDIALHQKLLQNINKKGTVNVMS